MKSKKFAFLVPLVAISVIWASSFVEARSGYLSQFGNEYPFTSGTKLDVCETCHVSGGKSRNPYGQTVEQGLNNQGCSASCSKSEAIVAIVAAEPYDSDGDSYINIDEINAITFPGDASDVPGTTCTDNDSDTYAVEGGSCGMVDCDDTDPAINPGATEVCDGIDNNCDSQIDEGCPTCTDNDGDTYAVEGGSCGQVDCDDTDPAINPGVAEICGDGIDNNCDGQIDEGCLICTDNDGDTYAVEGGSCGLVDCDDSDPAVNPGATEVCDGIDNNCDGQIDEGCPTCTDNDGDTYAVEGGSCGQVDCDDTDPAINPGATEVCGDGIDNNCDGQIDEGCGVCTDADGDGYYAEAGCGTEIDCDDTNPDINPGACDIKRNGIDEDCDGADRHGGPACGGVVTEICDDGIDNDGDGDIDCADADCIGDPACGGGCTPSQEICDDGIDNDCDGKVDCSDKKDCKNFPGC